MRHYNSIQIIISHCFRSLYVRLSLIHDILMCNLFDCTLRAEVCAHSGKENPDDEKKKRGRGGVGKREAWPGDVTTPFRKFPQKPFS